MDERICRFPEAINSTMVQVFRYGMRKRRIRPGALAKILDIEILKAEALVWTPVSVPMRTLLGAAQFLNVVEELNMAQSGVNLDHILEG